MKFKQTVDPDDKVIISALSVVEILLSTVKTSSISLEVTSHMKRVGRRLLNTSNNVINMYAARDEGRNKSRSVSKA